MLYLNDRGSANTKTTRGSRTSSVVDVLGVPIAAMELDEALQTVRALTERDEPATVAFANAHTVNLACSISQFRSTLRAMDVVFNDGIGVDLAARAQGLQFPANLNGTDFTPAIIEMAAAQGWSVFFYGARPGVAERVAQAMSQRFPDLFVAGTAHGFGNDPAGDTDKIRSSGADIVLVALGNPRQEMWLERHLAATGARLGVAVGGFFDFAAGEVARAPQWMRRAHLEWLHRLACEPRRMFRRYVLGNPLFLVRILHHEVTSRTAHLTGR